MFKIADDVDSFLSELLDTSTSKYQKPQISKEKYQLPIKIGISGKQIEEGDKPWIVGHFAPGKYLNETHPKGHDGTDLKAPKGTLIYSIASGIVVDTNITSIGGKTCKIASENGNVISYYAHMDDVKVTPQQNVNQNTIIGIIGQTGNAKGRGEHLHFEVKVDGKKIDPLSIVGKEVGTLSQAKKIKSELIFELAKTAGLLKIPEELFNNIFEYVKNCYLIYIKNNIYSFDDFNKSKIESYLEQNISRDENLNKETFKYKNYYLEIKINFVNKPENAAEYEFLGRTKNGDYYNLIDIFFEASLPEVLEEIENEILFLKDSVRHELQHFMQKLMTIEAGFDPDDFWFSFGLPKKKLKQRDYLPSGAPKRKMDSDKFLYDEKERLQHELRDEEFYTNLSDEISIFKDIISTIPESEKEKWIPALAKIWVGEKAPGWIKNPEQHKQSKFFKTLKEKKFSKWKKAVKEFYKALNLTEEELFFK